MERLSASVRAGVEYIIAKENVGVSPVVEVSEGSKVGDGYSSKTYAISIKGAERTLHLFAKYLPEDNIKYMLGMYQSMFHQEIRFYEEILPAMLSFQQSKNILCGFENVPKYYRVEGKDGLTPPVILENLKQKGYTLREYKESIDEAHINLTLITQAKLHAISYAMKDQQLELFQKHSSGVKDILCEAHIGLGITDHIAACVEHFLRCLDPKVDKYMLEKCANLGKDLVELVSTVPEYMDNYSAICQGDCWSNNMMYLYDEQGILIDIKVIDFQEQKVNSPVLDIVYFFYTVATKDSLANFDRYRDLYYNTLAEYIQKLGSDPNKMFPREIFHQHWKKFAKFGLAMVFFVVRELFQSHEDIPNILESEDGKIPLPSSIFCGQDVFNERMKMIIQHFIERDFL